MNIFGRIVFSVQLILSVLLPSIFLILNIHENFSLVVSTMPPILGFGAVAPIYFHLMMNRVRIHSLLEDLHDIVEESKSIIALLF